MSEEKESFRSKTSQTTLQLAGAAVFGALSIVLAVVATFLPRTPEGFAYFDPVSIVWILCFIIFGPVAGILCSIIGMIGLMFFDPFAPIGPLLKLCATLPMIIVPTLLKKLYKPEVGSDVLLDRKNYFVSGIIAIVIRIVIMVPINIAVYIALGFPMAGLGYWIIIVILLNGLQGLWDMLVPYIIVVGAKINERFEIW